MVKHLRHTLQQSFLHLCIYIYNTELFYSFYHTGKFFIYHGKKVANYISNKKTAFHFHEKPLFSKQCQLICFRYTFQNTIFFEQVNQRPPQRCSFFQFFNGAEFPTIFSTIHNALCCICAKPLQ